MRYNSTRNSGETVDAAQAIVNGIAPDGGLYVPSSIPKITDSDFASLMQLQYNDMAKKIISPFLEDFDKSEIESITDASYGTNFDHEDIAPVHFVNSNTAYLELWHGPTCAFKDMALQMLPHLLRVSLKKCSENRELCILVATSGDTGKAALEGFADVKGTNILVFYPRDGVSATQRLQMVTQQGENVHVCAVEGNFDDVQTGVKKIFADTTVAEQLNEKGHFLSSANSINWGRLLPQIVYYFSAYRDFLKSGSVKAGEKLNFCVPTGNFGDILAGWYAMQMGLPVGKLICASNANNILTDFFETGKYDTHRPFHITTSPSMDILISSNLERLLFEVYNDSKEINSLMSSLKTDGHFEVSASIKERISAVFDAGCCSDEDAANEIARVWSEHKYLIDTHTAVGSRVLESYRQRSGDARPTCIVSTASPFKFSESVLSALHAQSDEQSGLNTDALSHVTGVPVPVPLTGLEVKKVRFGKSVSINEMSREVLNFLK